MYVFLGTCRHGQEGALGSLRKCRKVFLCISSYSKRLGRRLFMHYFHNLLSASGGFARAPSLDPAGDLCSQTPNLPTPGKNPADTHTNVCIYDKYLFYPLKDDLEILYHNILIDI